MSDGEVDSLNEIRLALDKKIREAIDEAKVPLDAHITNLELVLKRRQWAPDGFCPWCASSEFYGHLKGCDLVRLLAARPE